MTNFKDDDLQKLLKPLKDSEPSSFQVETWKFAVEREARLSSEREARLSRKPQSIKFRWALQLAAALCVGIFVGALGWNYWAPRSEHADVMAHLSEAFEKDSATFELSHTNLD